MNKKSIVAAASAATLMVSAPAWGFSFDDIHFWVGEGTNRCAVALDFGNESLAWGYKWNGTCTNLLEVMNRIVDQDHRLVMGCQPMGTYYAFYFFGYDKDDGAASWDKRNGNTSSTNALWGMQTANYSQWWVLYGPMKGSTFPTSGQTSSRYAVDQITPVDGDWFAFVIGSPIYDVNNNWAESPAVLDVPTAAESPYGWRVVDSYVTTEDTEWGSDKVYNNENTVLGRPTAYMTEMWGGPVNPYNPAWHASELLTLDGEDNFVTIEFDHAVVDDPANPFGIDFIVFGNSFSSGKGDYYSQSDDPAKLTFTGGSGESARVEVSQDGKTWYEFTNGPRGDDFAPTLGFVYDDVNPDARLFPGNNWWGKMTDACYPVDPAVSWSDLAGLTLAEVAKRYNGSAGGTGFDIGKLNLPVDSKGRKWFRYVRITGMDSEYPNAEGDITSSPEVDAVADVAPVSGYKNWVCDNFTWDKAWQTNLTDFAAIAANGLANGLNYMYGIAADTPVPDAASSFKVASFEPGETEHVIKMRSPTQLTATPNGLVVQKTSSLGSGWQNTVVPTFVSSVQDGDVWLNTFTVPNDPNDGAKFFKLALDE